MRAGGDMEILEFAKAATRVGTIEMKEERNGWSVAFRERVSGKWISCTQQTGGVRTWKSPSVLINQQREAGYRGTVVFPVSAQMHLEI